jgi:serine protease Do
MNRSTILGAAGGLVAGVSLATLALAAPSHALFNGGPAASVAAPAAASVVAPAAAQLAAPAAAQQARWGVVPNLADLVEKVSPSVVKIEVRSPNQARQLSQFGGQGVNPFEGTPFERFFSPSPGQGQPGQELPDLRGSGSGFIIQGGYIVTNNHVVDNASRMTVVLNDERELPATLVGRDEKTDLAVIKVEARDLPPPLPWGNSDRARPGDNVFAVGAPFGLGNSVSAGIVSARNRNIGGSYDDYIQVDAPINRGNSGGPLFDSSGQVIGVNSAIFSPTGGNVGIGFSISSKLAQKIVNQIVANGSVERGWLGVAIGPVTPEIASSLSLASAKGAIVQEVTANSPAERAGVKAGDIIVSYAGQPINHVQDLTTAVADTKAGTTRELRIVRGGRQQTLQVRIAELKSEEAAELAANSPSPSLTSSSAGAVTLNDLGLGLATSGSDVVISNVKVNSPAADAQPTLRRGDKIVSVNQTPVASAEAAKKAIEDAKKQKRTAVMLQVERQDDGQTRKFFVGVPFSDG